MTKPAPFSHPDTDVRDLDGFMLNVERLLASELVAIGTPEECWAALMLWCRAWKQIPAGSLPNDNRILASFSGAGKRWAKVRDMALRGFVECADGRLYHRFLCAEAAKAFGRKMAFLERRTNDAKRLKNWRGSRTANDPGWEGLRQAVFERDGQQCVQCGSPDDLHADHIIPRRHGGTEDLTNLQAMCRRCHGQKTATERHRYGRETVSRPLQNGGEVDVVAEGQGQGQGQIDSESDPIGSPKTSAHRVSAGGKEHGRATKLRFPPDWLPDDTDLSHAGMRGHGPTWIDEQARLCRDHHAARGNAFLDFHAVWRTWVANAERFEKRDGIGRSGGHRSAAPSFVEAARAAFPDLE